MAAYPRKQTVVIFILCAFAVGGTAYYVKGGNDSSAALTGASQDVAIDTSYDTTSANNEWQEQFLTSGAGFKATPQAQGTGDTTTAENLTATDRLGRSIFGKYVELKKMGLSDDATAISNVVEESLAELGTDLAAPKVYAKKDISITTDSAAVLKSYGQVIASSISDYVAKDDEALLVLKAFESQDAALLADIDPIIRTYQSMISRLLATPAPQSLAARHLELINGLSAALYSAQSFRAIDTNPVQALAGISLNATAEQSIAASFAAIQSSIASTSKTTSS